MFAFRWSKILILFLFLLVCLPCRADEYSLLNHVTLREYPAGSFVVRYGGLRGFVRNQLKHYFHALHRDSTQLRYFDNPIRIRRELVEMSFLQDDVDDGGAWFKRDWWYSLPAIRGGAPKHPIRAYRGPTGKLIDIGIAYVTADFRFKWREYEVSLTKAFEVPESQLLHEYRYVHEWRLRIKPTVSFSTSDIIRQIRLGLFFEYSHKKIKLISIGTYASWYPVDSIQTVWFGISISLLRW